MKKNLCLLIAILLLNIALHLLMIGNVPPGLNNDEVVDGYDAYSILETGKDQWGKSFPLEFKSFGDYKLPLFIYSLVPVIFILGLNIFSLKIAALFFSLIFIVIFYLLVNKLFNQTVALVAAFLLTISPWFFALTRVAHEGPLQALLIMIGVYFFLQAIEKGKWFFPSFFFFALSFYTYHSARLFVPTFLLILLIYLRKKIYKQKRWLMLTLVMTLLFCLPMIKAMIYGGAKARLMQTNITKDIGLINVLNEKRGECLKNTAPLLCKFLYNKPLVFSQKFANNYINHFSFSFLFLKGSASGLMGERRYFYLSFIPILLAGIFFLLKQKGFNALVIITWLLIAPLADSFTSEGHYGRAFLMIIPICIISAFGLSQLTVIIKNNFFRKTLILILSLTLLLESIIFFSDYFFYFPVYYSYATHYEYQPLFEYLKTIEKNYNQIYISRRYHDTKQYAFYLFYSQYNPKNFQEGKDIEVETEKDGWLWVRRVGKWHFVASMPTLEDIPDKSLLIGNPKEEINNLITSEAEIAELGKPIVRRLKTINYLNGDTAFAIAEVRKK